MDSVEHVRRYLSQFGAEDRVIEFTVSSATVALAAQALGCEEGRIAKTLSFMAGTEPVLIVAAGDQRIDNRKYKARFGTKARMMRAEELEALTGLHFGGVCPFDIPDTVSIYLDESLRAWDIVYPAAGNEASAVRVTPEELERFSGAKGWVDVCKGPGEGAQA
ncbi:MAG: YbaK/EbsC family protein [Clostridia bacterium]|nr:YbaK/EbsC family protein [Clostridia bacterium]